MEYHFMKKRIFIIYYLLSILSILFVKVLFNKVLYMEIFQLLQDIIIFNKVFDYFNTYEYYF